MSVIAHRKSLALVRGLLVVPLCSIGCSPIAPSRPASVSASAVRTENGFIECSDESGLSANTCTVWDSRGILLENGFFILNYDGRAATKSELKYVAFHDGKIYLQGDRFLYPVLPMEKERVVLDSKLALLAGHGVMTARDCGRIALNQNRAPASECALKALTDKKPFHIRYDLQGYEGIYSFGLAGDGSEDLYAVEDYSLLADLPPLPGTRIVVTPCPKPINTRMSPGGIITCLPTNP